MFDEWVDQLDDLTIPVDTPGLSRALSALSRLQAKIATTVGLFDLRELWDAEGATSMTAWLKARGLAAGDAAHLAMTGRRTRALPTLTEAWEPGASRPGRSKRSWPTSANPTFRYSRHMRTR